jgi:hypothetical protein
LISARSVHKKSAKSTVGPKKVLPGVFFLGVCVWGASNGRLSAEGGHSPSTPTVEQLTCGVMAIIERLPLVRSAK